MKEGPDISRVAALIGDPARANMLSALMDTRARTAGELSAEAGVTKQTASSHLAQLLDAGLVHRDVQGRHHYYRLAGPDVAAALEALMTLSDARAGRRLRAGPSDPSLRKARVCYDHLAGELGVLMFDRMTSGGWIGAADDALSVSDLGWKRLKQIGIESQDFEGTRRPQCRTCLDWSMRRYHLAGSGGNAVLERIFQNGWARRSKGSRAVVFTPEGEGRFRRWLEGSARRR
ncbi:MAG TPA: helix-turn-helix transcriptional regulator [Hyphomonas sp.]|nr:ArsR family transcriptional regulator [Hyphomonas sp.]HRI99691.1 helix-turn-helix transcriptional regulator [Hyphomonas sp.]HRK67057.1 helix-turn-helix transcriptional regulator [Hyphomonas sp.]